MFLAPALSIAFFHAGRRPGRPRAVFALTPLAIAWALPSWAQTATAPAPTATALPAIVVTTPSSATPTVAPPAATLDGDALTLRRGTTLGDTLDGLPGVAASAFGPNASRPLVRGQEGDRARVLMNAGASFDASTLSADHALPIDPLLVERIELLRGPAALQYGGNAVGGVVNAIDHRLPKDRLDGVDGAGEARLGGAEDERAAAALVEAGNGRFALHADAFGRRTSDLRVPRHTVPGESGETTTRVRNSAARTSGGAVGGAFTFDRGHLGIAADSYDSTYGTVAEPDVTIRMKRDQARVAGEVRDLAGALRAVRGQLGRTVYRHEEVEGSGAIGTTFHSRGTDARLEADHAPLGTALGALRGTLGVQAEDADFSALGEEAFVPGTRTRRQAAFAVERLDLAPGTLTAGLRLEKVQVDSAGDVDGGSGSGRFGPAQRRRFGLTSAALAQEIGLAPGWTLTVGASHVERAPTFAELYANGLHVATGAFEVGDASLGKERGNAVEGSLAWRRDAHTGMRIAAFTQRFSHYIALEATGATVTTAEGEPVPVYAFQGVPARFDGIEIDARRRWTAAGWTWDAAVRLDHVRATRTDTGEPLPRIAPLRARLGLEASQGPWRAAVEIDHAARQDRVPATDRVTAGFTRVNLTLARSLVVGETRALAFLKLANAGDRLAYSATAMPTVRDLAPLGGRALKAGLRISF